MILAIFSKRGIKCLKSSDSKFLVNVANSVLYLSPLNKLELIKQAKEKAGIKDNAFTVPKEALDKMKEKLAKAPNKENSNKWRNGKPVKGFTIETFFDK